MTITEVTDLDKTPDGILVEDLGSDYEADMCVRDKENMQVFQNDSAKGCNTIQQPKQTNSSKKDFTGEIQL